MEEIKLPIAALTDEDIVAQDLEARDLWLINYQEHILGPYTGVQIYQMVTDQPEWLDQWELCSLENEEWIPLAKAPFFEQEEEGTESNYPDEIQCEAQDEQPDFPAEMPCETHVEQELSFDPATIAEALPSKLTPAILKICKQMAQQEVHHAEEEHILGKESIIHVASTLPQIPKSKEQEFEDAPSELNLTPKIWKIPLKKLMIPASAMAGILLLFFIFKGDSSPIENEESLDTQRSPAAVESYSPNSFNRFRAQQAEHEIPVNKPDSYQQRKAMLEQQRRSEFDENQKERMARLKKFRHPKAMMEFHQPTADADRELAEREYEEQRRRDDEATTNREPAQTEPESAPADTMPPADDTPKE